MPIPFNLNQCSTLKAHGIIKIQLKTSRRRNVIDLYLRNPGSQNRSFGYIRYFPLNLHNFLFMCIKSSTLDLINFFSLASSSRIGMDFEEEEGRKRRAQFLWNEMWPLKVLIVSWAFALCLFDLDGFPLLLEDVSKELQCFTDAFFLVVVGFVPCGSFIH